MRPGSFRCHMRAPGLSVLLSLFGVFGFLIPPLHAEAENNSLLSIEKQLKSALPLSAKALVGIDFGESGFGSGVIVNKEGLILTAAHVSGGVDRPCTVILSDGKRIRGVTLGLNAANDAGSVQITTEGTYDFIPLAKELPQRGEWVFALGHAGGFFPERGWVTRLGKVIHSQDDAIRTDCKLIGGDSGGPLFNMAGELIGIHSRVGMVLEDNIHVPITEFKKDWTALLKGEWIKEGPFTQKIPGKLNVLITESPEGLLISDLEPYEKALQEKDILTQWNGVDLKTKKQLSEFLASSYAGQKVTLSVHRQGESIQIPFTLRMPPPPEAMEPPIRIPDFFTPQDEAGNNKKGEEEE